MAQANPSQNEKINPYEVALIYWTKLRGRERTWGNVAKELGFGDRQDDPSFLNKLGRMARLWEERDLVRHTVFAADSDAKDRPPRVYALEEQMRMAFPLRHVVVMDTRLIEASDLRLYDDNLHELLGSWAARILGMCMRGGKNENGELIGDVIGVGAGRGPFHTVTHCRHDPRLGSPVKVVSLVGRLNAGAWADPSRKDYDADHIAGAMDKTFEVGMIQRVKSNIVPEKGLAKPSLHTEEVTFALVGAGSLAHGHRLYQYEGNPSLEPIREELKELKNLVDAVEKELPLHPHVVGDLCNRLFVCKPKNTDGMAEKRKQFVAEKLKQIQELIDRLNERFLCPSLEQIRGIRARGGVLCVCGGVHKISAVKHLLELADPVISHLCIDDLAAIRILEQHYQERGETIPEGARQLAAIYAQER